MSKTNPTNTAANALALAAAFAAVLEQWGGSGWQRRRIDQMVANAKGEGVSAAHDWCDANVCMLDAFDSLGWLSPLDQSDENGDSTAAWDGEPGHLMRRAWSLADGCAWDALLLARAWLDLLGRGERPSDDASADLMRQIAAGRGLQ